MGALGAVIASDGRPEGSATHRMDVANSRFWSRSAVLSTKLLPFGVKYKRWASEIVPSLLHAAGGWTWNKQLHGMLSGWEGRRIRKVWGSRRKEDEN